MNHLTVLDNIRKQRDYLYSEIIADNGISSFNTETTSEKNMVTLLTNVYSKYWIFSNPFKSFNKELCDCLIISHNDIIVISDKERDLENCQWNCLYQGKGFLKNQKNNY